MAGTTNTPVERPPVEAPLYTLWDAARYLHVPVWSVLAFSGRLRPHPEGFLHHAMRRWPHFNPDDDGGFPFNEQFPRVTFTRLAEFFVRSYVLRAVWELGRAGKWKTGTWPLVEEVLWSALDDRLGDGSGFDAEAVAEFARRLARRVAANNAEADDARLTKLAFRYVDRVAFADGLPARLYPFSRDPVEDSPRVVVMDPHVRFGRPTVEGYGVPTDILLERFHAGDSAAELASDYDIPAALVDEAIRYETLPPAPLYPPFFEW